MTVLQLAVTRLPLMPSRGKSTLTAGGQLRNLLSSKASIVPGRMLEVHGERAADATMSCRANRQCLHGRRASTQSMRVA